MWEAAETVAFPWPIRLIPVDARFGSGAVGATEKTAEKELK